MRSGFVVPLLDAVEYPAAWYCRGLMDVGVEEEDDEVVVGAVAVAVGVEPELRWAKKNGLDGSADVGLATMALARVGLSGAGDGAGSTGSFLCPLVNCAHKCICDR
jgi:hypothetical protein